MLTNTEKSTYLWCLESRLFEQRENSFISELLPIYTAAQKDRSSISPIKYRDTIIEYPYLSNLDENARNMYRKPITVTDPKICESLDDYINKKGVYDRRKAHIIAFTKRMMWKCSVFGDLAYIEPKAFHDKEVFWLAKEILEKQYPDQSFYTDPTPKHDKLRQEFYAKETEALKEIDRHILIEQLTG